MPRKVNNIWPAKAAGNKRTHESGSEEPSPRTKKLRTDFDQILLESEKLESDLHKEKEAHASTKSDLIRAQRHRDAKLESELRKEKEAHGSTKLDLGNANCRLSNALIDRGKAYRRGDNYKSAYNGACSEKNQLKVDMAGLHQTIDSLEERVEILQTERDELLAKQAEQGPDLEEALTHMKYAVSRVKVRDNLSEGIRTILTFCARKSSTLPRH